MEFFSFGYERICFGIDFRWELMSAISLQSCCTWAKCLVEEQVTDLELQRGESGELESSRELRLLR